MSDFHLPHDHGQNIDTVLQCMPQSDAFSDAAALFSHLGDANRLRIFWILCHAEECVMNLSAAVGMSSPAASHHLRILRAAGLITSRRVGKEVYYRMNPASRRANLLHRFMDAVFDVSCPAPCQEGCPSEPKITG